MAGGLGMFIGGRVGPLPTQPGDRSTVLRRRDSPPEHRTGARQVLKVLEAGLLLAVFVFNHQTVSCLPLIESRCRKPRLYCFQLIG